MRSKTTPKSEVDKVKRDLAALRGDLRDLSEALFASVRGKAEAASEAVSERVAEGGEALHDVLSRLRDNGHEAMGSVKDTVKGHPVISIASAFAVGFLVGKLLDR
jgi:ElaB/YqjD/DUF883 family membrane-anchored ribosome-binding protein